jgi:hypothetical protein
MATRAPARSPSLLIARSCESSLFRRFGKLRAVPNTAVPPCYRFPATGARSAPLKRDDMSTNHEDLSSAFSIRIRTVVGICRCSSPNAWMAIAPPGVTCEEVPHHSPRQSTVARS